MHSHSAISFGGKTTAKAVNEPQKRDTTMDKSVEGSELLLKAEASKYLEELMRGQVDGGRSDIAWLMEQDSKVAPLVEREIGRYHRLLKLAKSEIAGEFNAEAKRTILRACEGATFDSPGDADLLSGRVLALEADALTEEESSDLYCLSKQLANLSSTARLALVDTVECHRRATSQGLASSFDDLLDSGVKPRSERFAALHEAGHAFMVVFQDFVQLKEVRIKVGQTPLESHEPSVSGYYEADLGEQEAYLHKVGGMEGHLEHVLLNMVAGRVAETRFPLQLNVTHMDTKGANHDYLHAFVLLSEHYMVQDLTNKGVLATRIGRHISLAEQKVARLFHTFDGCLYELWLTLAERLVLTGEEVKAIMCKHGALSID
jgi:hypothetical protein